MFNKGIREELNSRTDEERKDTTKKKEVQAQEKGSGMR